MRGVLHYRAESGLFSSKLLWTTANDVSPLVWSLTLRGINSLLTQSLRYGEQLIGKMLNEMGYTLKRLRRLPASRNKENNIHTRFICI